MPTPKTPRINYPLAIERPLYARVTAVARKTGMSRQAVMKLSIERGLDVLLQQLNAEISISKP